MSNEETTRLFSLLEQIITTQGEHTAKLSEHTAKLNQIYEVIMLQATHSRALSARVDALESRVDALEYA